MGLTKYQCGRCGRSWVPRKENPKTCPTCHCRFIGKTGNKSQLNRYTVVE